MYLIYRFSLSMILNITCFGIFKQPMSFLQKYDNQSYNDYCIARCQYTRYRKAWIPGTYIPQKSTMCTLTSYLLSHCFFILLYIRHMASIIRHWLQLITIVRSTIIQAGFKTHDLVTHTQRHTKNQTPFIIRSLCIDEKYYDRSRSCIYIDSLKIMCSFHCFHFYFIRITVWND